MARNNPFDIQDKDGATIVRDEVKLIKTDVVSDTLTYRGRAHNLEAADTNLVWQIERITKSGNITTSDFAVDVEGVPSYTFAFSARGTTAVFPTVAYQSATFLRCDGSDDFVTLGDQALLDFDGNTEAFSISATFKTCSAAEQVIFSKQGAADAEGYRLTVHSGGIRMHISGGAAGDRIEVRSSFAKLNDNKEHTVVMTFDGSGDASGVSMIVDGVTDSSLTLTADTLTTTSENATAAQICGRTGAADVFDGFLDEVAIWDVELTDAEAKAIYISGFPGDLNQHTQSVQLVAWYTFEGDTFPAITDQSDVGNSIDGTMTNFSGPHDLVTGTGNEVLPRSITTADSTAGDGCDPVTGTTVGTDRTLDVAVKETVGSTFTPSGLNTAILITTLDVTSAAALPLPATALTNRNSMVVHNTSTDDTLYVGPTTTTADNVVGTTSGQEVGPGETFAIDIAPGIVLFGRTEAAKTVRVKVTEVS